jgi:hypothetical protein
VLSTNLCTAQLCLIQNYLGNTEAELFENIKNDINSFRVYDDSKRDQITFAYEMNIENHEISVLATCHFKKNKFYKVHNRFSSNLKNSTDSKGRSIENGYQLLYKMQKKLIQEELYTEVKEQEIKCCDMGYYSTRWTKPDRYIILHCFPEEWYGVPQEVALVISIQ